MKKRLFAAISGMMALALCMGAYAAPETADEKTEAVTAETEEDEAEYFFDVQLVEPYAKENIKYFGNSLVSVNDNGKYTELKVKKDVKWDGHFDEKSCFIAGENYTAVVTFEGDIEKILGIQEVDTDDFSITMPDYFEYVDLEQKEDNLWEVTLSLSIRKMPKSKDKKHKHDKPMPENKIGKKEASCEEDGFQIYDCQCGYREIKDINALGHDMKDDGSTKATCVKDGAEKEKCSRCGKTNEKKIDALGHDWETVANKPATCEEAAEQINECSRCHEKDTIYTADALGHDYQREGGAAADCEHQGTKWYVCKRSGCNSEYTEYIDALGHDYQQAGGGAASCVSPGSEWYVCARPGCTAEYTEEIPPMGHDSACHWNACNRCSDVWATAGHDLEITYNSDSTEYSCWCGYYYYQPIP